jgi:hypothetical protein
MIRPGNMLWRFFFVRTGAKAVIALLILIRQGLAVV